MIKEYKFPCEQCGAKLKFSASEGELKCEHCSHINSIERSFENIVEKDYYKALETLKNISEKSVEISSVKCQSCAAVFDISEDIHSSTCPYCSSAIVNETALYRPIKPQGILPFKVTKKEARDIFKKWLKDRWFAPNKLKRYGAEDSQLKGIYIPHWTYDSDTFSSYRGRRGDKYYVNETYTQNVNGQNQTKTRQVTKIRWSNVEGTLNRTFDDVLVMASSSLKHELSNWDLENLVDYNESYLSGYESEVYSIEIDQGLVSAKQFMQNHIRQAIKQQIGGDEQEINSLDSQYSNITFKHILLPVYASAFNFNGKVYSYVVNGRNGDISGNRPYSTIKIALTVIAVAAVVGTGYYFFN